MQTDDPQGELPTPPHPTVDDLRAYLLDRLDPVDDDRVREHVRAGCVRCLHVGRWEAARLRETIGVPTRQRAPDRQRGADSDAVADLDLLLRHAAVIGRQEVFLEGERAAASGLLRELLLLAPAARRDALRSGERYRFYGLAERLTADCRAECFHDVARAVELGRLAVEAADGLPRGAYPPGAVVDVVALAWAALGNAHRVQGELIEAERALQVALDRLGRGSQDRTVRAEILSLLGSLRTDQARFDEADGVLATASRFFRNVGDDRNRAKALLQQANARGELGDVRRAAALAAEARAALEAVEDDRLQVLTAQAFAYWLRESDEIAKARDVLAEVRVRYASAVAEPVTRLRLEWIDARLAWSEGDREGAERALHTLRADFRERNFHYDACLVDLDLAQLYLEQGRTAEVRRLAGELAATFRSQQIHHHAMAALALFQQAVGQEEVTVGFVRQLARYLRHARHNTHLAFQPAT